MALLLFLVVLAVPLVEIYLMIQVGGAIGALPTIGLLLLSAVVGVVIVKREGLGIIRRLQTQMRVGDSPGNDLLDGVLIVLAGVLLVIPGFLSDAVALLLLVPPVRRFARSAVAHRVQARIATLVERQGMAFGAAGVYDTRVVEDLGDVTPPRWQDHPGRSAGRNELNP